MTKQNNYPQTIAQLKVFLKPGKMLRLVYAKWGGGEVDTIREVLGSDFEGISFKPSYFMLGISFLALKKLKDDFIFNEQGFEIKKEGETILKYLYLPDDFQNVLPDKRIAEVGGEFTHLENGGIYRIYNLEDHNIYCVESQTMQLIKLTGYEFEKLSGMIFLPQN